MKKFFVRTGLWLLLCVQAQSVNANSLLNPVIPRGPSEAERLATGECSSASPSQKETFFGFSFSGVQTDAGYQVGNIDIHGPANGSLLAGDIIVSLNGDALAGRLESIMSVISIERGIYIYGLRDGLPFEAVVWSCVGQRTPLLITRKLTLFSLEELYPEFSSNSNLRRAGLPLLLAAYNTAKTTALIDGESYNAFAPSAMEYCNLRPQRIKSYSLTRRVTDKNRFGSVLRSYETTQDYFVEIDTALYDVYMDNFDYIRTIGRTASGLALVLQQNIIEPHGCASPEFKDLEKRLYHALGANW